MVYIEGSGRGNQARTCPVYLGFVEGGGCELFERTDRYGQALSSLCDAGHRSRVETMGWCVCQNIGNVVPAGWTILCSSKYARAFYIYMYV